jgi:hypothetical protein
VHAARARIGAWHTVSEPEAPRDWVLRAPIAAWGVALHRSMQTQASNGSEIALFTLLAVGGLLWVANHPRQTGFAAALYALSVLVRPEGWILSATAFAFAWWCSCCRMSCGASLRTRVSRAQSAIPGSHPL